MDPPLNEYEAEYVKQFQATRRMQRSNGPYYVLGTGMAGQGHDTDIQEYNRPHPEQPGLWCQWEPSDDGTEISWDGVEKFYSADEWMKYIIDHFLKPGAVLQERLQSGWFADNGYPVDERFKHFTFDHVCNGKIEAQGEDPEDRWRLVVEDNVVYVERAGVVWGDREKV